MIQAKPRNSYFVSIIIPVYNNAKGLGNSLRAISKQTYPRKLFETIVVDNGSNDNPEIIARQFGAIFLKEYKHLNSPYSARNRGIEISKGEIIVLLDATCTPVENWLLAGINKISERNDIVGGNIIFDISNNSSVGEIYDSMINIRMKESIIERSVAKTTNLFIKKHVINCIGLFPEGLRSGGDVRWTGKATKSGYKLAFSEEAKAYITPRTLRPLIQKQWRVAKYQPAIWLEQGMSWKKYIKLFFYFLPPNPIKFFHQLRKNNEFYRKKEIRLYFVAYLIRIVTYIGNVVGFCKLLSGMISKIKQLY